MIDYLRSLLRALRAAYSVRAVDAWGVGTTHHADTLDEAVGLASQYDARCVDVQISERRGLVSRRVCEVVEASEVTA